MSQKLEGGKADDLRLLAGLRHVQCVRASGLGLTTLEGLDHLPYLTHLVARGNRLEELMDVTWGKYLRTADLADNRIRRLGGLGGLPLLCVLNLSGNALPNLDGLDGLACLERLDVSRCGLSSLEGVGAAANTLVQLTAAGNDLTSLAPVVALKVLTHLDVSDNADLDDLAPLAHASRLRVFAAARCRLTRPASVLPLTALPLLWSLDVRGNDLAAFCDASRHLLYVLPGLTVLDGAGVDPREKVVAANAHGADLEALREIRRRLLPEGELDDYGGSTAPISAILPACPGGATPSISEAAVVDAVPWDAVAGGVTPLAAALVAAAGAPCGAGTMAEDVAVLWACYAWVRAAVSPPADGDGWRVGPPVLREDLRAHEDALFPLGKGGAWAERVARLFCNLCSAGGLVCHPVTGFVKAVGSAPDTRHELPNHCWAVAQVGGRWRLVDPAMSVLPGCLGQTFWTSPADFVTSHLPIAPRWQLLADAVSPDAFWAAPQLAPAFHSVGLRAPEGVPRRVGDDGVYTLTLLAPARSVIYPELLTLPDLTPCTPTTAGSYFFAQVIADPEDEGAADALAEWELVARPPGPGRYCLRVKATSGGEGDAVAPPVEVAMVLVDVPPGVAEGGLLPSAHRQWLWGRATLVAPTPTDILVPGAKTPFSVVAPGVDETGGIAVGVRGGQTFTPLERVEGDQWEGVAVVPNDGATEFCLTTLSAECPGSQVFLPLLVWPIARAA